MSRYGLRRYAKRFLDVPRWIGADAIFHGARSIKAMYSAILSAGRPENVRTETYEEAIERLQLSSEVLEQRRRFFALAACAYLLFALVALGYLIILYLHHHTLAVLVCAMVVLLFLALAFKEHFWYTQMKQQRLGMTISEWFWVSIGRGS